MKERVYLNRITIDYQTLYARVKDYFHRHGVEIDFEFTSSDIKNLTYEMRNFGHGARWILKPYMANVVPIDTSYDFTSFAFNGMEFTPPNIPNGYCYCPLKQPFIDILLDERTPDTNYLGIIHEHMHAITLKANQKGFNVPDVMDTYDFNSQPENPLSNFSQQWALLKPFLNSQVYQYFKLTESTGSNGHTVAELKPELMQLLDKARGLAGIPFKITSGMRTPSENIQAGGVSDSAHLTGEAADVACSDSQSRLKIVKACLDVGFTRIEIATAHVHVDVSKTLPQNVMVLSEKS